MNEGVRGMGRTSKQLEQMPKRGLFVWCNDRLDYPKNLCRHLGRQDIQIISPTQLCQERCAGLIFSAVVVDHALRLTPKQEAGYNFLLTRIRSPKI